jgi:hypothetical protein
VASALRCGEAARFLPAIALAEAGVRGKGRVASRPWERPARYARRDGLLVSLAGLGKTLVRGHSRRWREGPRHDATRPFPAAERPASPLPDKRITEAREQSERPFTSCEAARRPNGTPFDFARAPSEVEGRSAEAIPGRGAAGFTAPGGMLGRKVSRWKLDKRYN